MCDPVTLTVVAVGAMAAGTGMSVYASQQQGKFQKDMMNYQSKLESQRAALAQKNAEIQVSRLAEQRRMETAAGMTGFAANGLLIDADPTSAPNVWEQDMAAETAWQQEEIRNQAMYEAWGYNANSRMLTAQGRMAREGAILEGWGTALSGTGSVLAMGASASAAGGKTSANYAGSSGTHGAGAGMAYA